MGASLVVAIHILVGGYLLWSVCLTVLVGRDLKVAKIGAAVAVSGLAAYGAYKIVKSGKMAKGRAAEREAIRLVRAGLGVDLDSPGQTTAVNRGNSAAFRVAMDRNRFNAKSDLAEYTFKKVSESIDKGKTSALKIFDNLHPEAGYNTYSLERQIDEGKFFRYNTNGQHFLKYETDPVYQILKDLYL